MTFTITEEWLGEHGVDIDAFMDALDAAGVGIYPTGIGNEGAYWIFVADDENGDLIPDFLAGLITDPITTNVSQGGAWG